MERVAALVLVLGLVTSADGADLKPLACMESIIRLSVGSESKCYVIEYDMIGSFQTAVETCWNQFKAFPISLDTREEVSVVFDYVRTHRPKYFDDDHGGTWLGAVKMTGVWHWFPGDREVRNHDMWEPLTGRMGDYALIRLSEATMEWDSVPTGFRDTRLRFLCELPQCPRGCRHGKCDSSFSCNCSGTHFHGELCELDGRTPDPVIEDEPASSHSIPLFNQRMHVETEVIGPELTSTLFLNCVFVILFILLLSFVIYAIKLYYEYGKSVGRY